MTTVLRLLYRWILSSSSGLELFRNQSSRLVDFGSLPLSRCSNAKSIYVKRSHKYSFDRVLQRIVVNGAP